MSERRIAARRASGIPEPSVRAVWERAMDAAERLRVPEPSDGAVPA